MTRTREILGDLVNYEEVTAIHPLEPPAIEKGEIPRFIHCPLFQKAQARIDSAMERHTQRVKQAEERVRQSGAHIASLEEAIEEWGNQARGVSLVNRLTLDRSSAASVDRYNRDVARHNDAVEQVRRYQDRLDDAIDRHHDLAQRYSEAVAEAQERLDELNLQALSEIDHDLVSFLDRCSQVVARLRESEAVADQEAALETCFIGLKVYYSFGEHIDAPAARQQARQCLPELGQQFVQLCASSQVHEALSELLRRNQSLTESNARLYSRLVETVGGVDQEEMDSLLRSLQARLNESFRTEFHYQGVVDPSRLESIMGEMRRRVQDLDRNIDQVKEIARRARPAAESGATAQQHAEAVLSQMGAKVQEMQDHLLGPRHFVRDLLDPAVIEGFYPRELGTAAASVRQSLLNSLGEEVVAGLLEGSSDPYALARGEQLIKDADLLRLRASLSRVEPHVGKLSNLAQGLVQDLEQAQQVPAQNAASFRSLTSMLFLLSCLPLVGLVAALFILKKVESFQPAFASDIPVYRELGHETLSRNKTFQTVNLFLGINAPAGLVLAQAGKRLSGYLNVARPAEETRGAAGLE